MTAEEKASAVLLALPKEAGDRVLAILGQDRGARLRMVMQRMEKRPDAQEKIDQIIGELDDLLRSRPAAPVAPPPAANGNPPPPSPPPAPPPSPPKQEKPAPPAGPTEAELEQKPVLALRSLSPARLALALQGEHPRTVALVLHQLEAQRAGEVLKELPGEVRTEVAINLTREPTASGEMLQRIARAILLKAQRAGGDGKQEGGASRWKRMADILRMLDRTERGEVLGKLQEQDPAAAAAIKDCLYDFEDILKIEDRSLQKLLTLIDVKTLALALKNAPEALVQKVFRNLSKRAGQVLSEEVQFLGAVPQAQVLQGRKVIVEGIQRMDQAGELVMVS